MPVSITHPPDNWDYQLASIYIGGWPCATDGWGCQWAAEEIDGWDSAELRRAQFDRLFNHGATLGKAYRSARLLTMKGTVVAPDRYALEAARDRLRRAIPIDSDVTLTANERPPKQLAVRRAGKVVFARVQGLTPGVPVASTFEVGMIAAQPDKTATAYQAVSLSPNTPSGGKAFPWGFPLRFTLLGVSGHGSLTNQGTADADTTIWWAGPLDWPVLTERLTGWRMQLQMSIPAGRVVVVDGAARTAMLDQDSVYGALSGGVLDPLVVPAGGSADLTVLGTGTGRVTVISRDTWE
jgi:hypothetical protein